MAAGSISGARLRAASFKRTQADSTAARFASRSESESATTRPQGCHNLIDFHIGRCFRTPLDELQLAFAQLLADRDAVGNADQIRIFKLHAGALVAIVEKCIKA